MAYLNGTAGGHLAMLRTIIEYACGFGSASAVTPGGGNVGNGSVLRAKALPGAVSETWTLTCTAAAANGGTFSVTGTVSGAQPAATVGTGYANGKVEFIITDGAIDFQVGDTFTFTATAGTLAGTLDQWEVMQWIGADEVLVSSERGSFERENALQAAGSWLTAEGAPLPAYFGLKMARPYAVQQLQLVGAGTAANSPRDFALQYSDDGVNWIALQSWTAWAPAASGTGTFTVTNPQTGPHLYWRIHITANNGGASVGLTEFRILDGSSGVSINHAVASEAVLKGSGLSGTEEIFVGVAAYGFTTADIFNLKTAVFTGFVASNTWNNQPGSGGALGFPLWDGSIPYWLTVNGQRITAVAQVDTTFHTFYIGKFFPYVSPGQYPYPVAHGSTMDDTALEDQAAAGHACPYMVGGTATARMKARSSGDSWFNANTWPWGNTSARLQAPINIGGTDTYALLPIVVYSSANLWGELDGVFFVTGFGNASGNTITVGADTYLVVPNVLLTGNYDFFALRLN